MLTLGNVSQIWNNGRAFWPGAASDAVLYIADSDVIFVKVQIVSIKIARTAPAQNYKSFHGIKALGDM